MKKLESIGNTRFHTLEKEEARRTSGGLSAPPQPTKASIWCYNGAQSGWDTVVYDDSPPPPGWV